ncbi:unnamed protein product [Bursaphelenchus okinawaensis]|uniref:N-acetylphosphatidylethanolamine-hydrolyzing phospholipase D n=1 Tax=Bursaphelenchus okinawaensis TaxID=465554 RepID=A0A811L9R9_9BILA|nr:unnamed protein product [Bursaphelenchus okinawaensis]CAG9119022.1 unnamed protein product [Bursaphelenchus okinawaensis]
MFAVPEYDGRYGNPKSFTNWPGLPGLKELFKMWFLTKNNGSVPGEEVLNKTLPVQKPVFDLTSKISATWLGHATVFVHLEEINFITDPVWADRVSPFSFVGPKRYREPPCKIEELPDIQFGVISHNHYDHYDLDAIRDLSTRFPKMKWFVPKGLRENILKYTQENEVFELVWGEHITVTHNDNSVKVWSVPAQHWSLRWLFDKNKSLWSGWVVEGPSKKFYFAGDTGYVTTEFEKIGKNLGPFDLSAIPIGAYAPRFFMTGQHIDPQEAVHVHKLVQSKKSMAIHWGTYPMGSYEPYMEPKTWLQEEVLKANLTPADFDTVNHGETITERQEKT